MGWCLLGRECGVGVVRRCGGCRCGVRCCGGGVVWL